MIDIQNLDFSNSRSFLKRFQILENSFGMDWYDCEDENAKYIWIIENIEKRNKEEAAKIVCRHIENQVESVLHTIRSKKE